MVDPLEHIGTLIKFNDAAESLVRSAYHSQEETIGVEACLDAVELRDKYLKELYKKLFDLKEEYHQAILVFAEAVDRNNGSDKEGGVLHTAKEVAKTAYNSYRIAGISEKERLHLCEQKSYEDFEFARNDRWD